MTRRSTSRAAATVAASPAPAAPAAAPAPAPEDAALGEPLLPLLTLAYTDLGVVRALPEVADGAAYSTKQVVFAERTIQQFKDTDGRTMRIVNAGGMAHKAPAPADPPTPKEGA